VFKSYSSANAWGEEYVKASINELAISSTEKVVDGIGAACDAGETTNLLCTDLVIKGPSNHAFVQQPSAAVLQNGLALPMCLLLHMHAVLSAASSEGPCWPVPSMCLV
jgi:hypothetical protein